MNSRCFLPILVFLSVSTAIHAQRATGENKPILYNDITGDSVALRRDAAKAYAAKFRIIETTSKDEFSPAGIKGFQRPFQDPRSMRDHAIPGKVTYTFIVTSDGRVIDLRILLNR